MLNSIVDIPERGLTPPTAAWWQGLLYLAYQSLDNHITIRRLVIDAEDVAGTSTATTLPWTAEGAPAIAGTYDRLWVAWIGPQNQLNFATSSDGVQFTQTGSHQVESVGDIAMVAIDGRLYAVTQENNGPLHLIRTYDGVTVEDFQLEGVGWGDLNLDWDTDRLLLGWINRDDALPKIGHIDLRSPAPRLQELDFPATAQARGVSLTTVGKHGGNRTIAVTEEPIQGKAFLSTPVGRTIRRDTGIPGGTEQSMTGPTLGLRLTSFNDRAYVSWRTDTDQLAFAPYDRMFGLPQELAELIGQDCDPKTCPPDPRITCAATKERNWIWDPPHIENARRGDVLMTPADGAGLIGTLLQAVTPPQYMDHMGIMIRDHYTVRHSTMAHKRVQNENYYDGDVFGEPMPISGLRGDLVKYGWPGTMTQNIEDSFYTGFNSYSYDPADPPRTSLNPRWDYYAFHPDEPRRDPPGPNATPEELDQFFRTRQFNDPERTGDQYPIHNMPNVPQFLIKEDRLHYARVIKPPPHLEARDPEIRASLHRVAAAAEALHSHYRFYAYSQAGIAQDSDYLAPGKADPYWDNKPSGADWSAGTPPTVCSSFLWAAVQRANAVYPRLILEGDQTESPDELLAHPSVDGLYVYTAEERQAAAAALTTLLSDGVRTEVREKLAKAADENPFLIVLMRFGVLALNALLLGPTGVALAALGCTTTQLADLTLVLLDMPDNIANQMANIFAFDEERNTDDDHWKSAPAGLAVSPDDIMEFWDVPTGGGSDERRGLWGHSERMLLVEGRWVSRLRHVYKENDGLAHVSGHVLYRGEPVSGAEVSIGCEHAMTGLAETEDIDYALDVTSGGQEMKAGAFWPDTNFWLAGRKVVSIEPGRQRIDIELADPPDWRRIVRVYGKLELVHRVLIGKDDWLHVPISFEARLSWTPEDEGPPFPGVDLRFQRFEWLSPLAGDERVHFVLTVALQEDMRLECGLSVQLLEDYYASDGEDLSDHIETGRNISFDVDRDGSTQQIVDQNSGEFPPDRGHLDLTIANDRAPA